MKKIDRKTYIIDAKEKVLGRISTQVADILRGKKKVYYMPNIDLGDNVVILNAKDVVLTGNKLDQKKYYRHVPRRPGGLKTQYAKDLMITNPEKVIYMSIFGMLPKNKLQKVFIKKLQIFKDDSYQVKGDEIKL